MNINDFCALLDRKGYVYTRADDAVDVNGFHNVDLRSLTTLPESAAFNKGGYVDLRSLTTLPESAAFNNGGGVDLRSLTTLPESAAFNNGGGVDLRSLTTLPESAAFNNGGYVYLSSLTTLPESAAFNNGGYVYLSSLTTLPESAAFNNGGYVYLSSLTDEYQSYRGERIRLKHIDGYTMLIRSERKLGETTIYSAAYFAGGEIADLKPCYVAHQGEHFAHGATIEQAMRDVRFKAMEHDFDEEELVAEIKERGTVLIEDFRLITGACEEGTRQGMADAGLDRDADELPLATVLSSAFGHYGERFKALFGEQALASRAH
ncbi:hypothetical protein [Novosphingobium soli]|uniref:hypothetical protein n=1 Tax=Novosphingobium soli TaxID=574956 RepID=UPI003631F2EB